jgi:hypothetical protein
VTGGAYVASALEMAGQPGSRLQCSENVCGEFICGLAQRYAVPGGPPCLNREINTYATRTADIDYVSPDAIALETHWYMDDSCGDYDGTLLPGADPLQTDSASVLITFAANNSVGTFVIDTVCIRPANHLAFINRNTELLIPSFSPGTITLACCSCLGDPGGCDGEHNVLDVLATIEVAFNDGARIPDYYAYCSVGAADYDCDGVTTVLDVVRAIGVAFRHVDPALAICAPCVTP